MRIPALKLPIKRGALLAAANWPIVVLQFIAESTFKILLAVPVVGGTFLVALALNQDVQDIMGDDLDLRASATGVATGSRNGEAQIVARHENRSTAVPVIVLPDGTGVDVAGELLGLGTAEGVVFFSGAADPSLLVRAAQLGEVVAKSGDLGTLLQAISAARTSAALVRRGNQPRPRTARR